MNTRHLTQTLAASILMTFAVACGDAGGDPPGPDERAPVRETQGVMAGGGPGAEARPESPPPSEPAAEPGGANAPGRADRCAPPCGKPWLQ